MQPLRRHPPRRKLEPWRGSALAIIVASCTSQVREPPRGADDKPPSSADRKDEEPPPADTPEPAQVQGAGDAEVAVDSPSDASTASTASAEGRRACPDDMVLVEGEHCSEVEQRCEKSWYDPNNKKTICERFAAPARCVGERSEKRYCIDRYEWPNRRGERPEVMNTFYQAQVKCAAAGKRMCTESEWTMACEGPELKPYPYGYARDATKCNGDRAWDNPDMKKVARRDPVELERLWQGVPSGSQPECVSDYGVEDLPGNADEVVASENFTSTWRGKYDSVTTGGPWYRGVRNQCRPKIYTHDEGFYYYYLGFRCCSEPDGAETDPRTPKQRKAGVKFEQVERLARFGVEEMREKLRLKASGSCSCAERDVSCKTMCGTLLAPPAGEAPTPARPASPAEGQSKETGK